MLKGHACKMQSYAILSVDEVCIPSRKSTSNFVDSPTVAEMPQNNKFSSEYLELELWSRFGFVSGLGLGLVLLVVDDKGFYRSIDDVFVYPASCFAVHSNCCF